MASIPIGSLASVHDCLQLIDNCCNAQIIDKDTLSDLHKNVGSILTLFQEKQKRVSTENTKTEISEFLKKWEKIKTHTSSIHNFDASTLRSLALEVKTALVFVRNQSMQDDNSVFSDDDNSVFSDDVSGNEGEAATDPFNYGLECVVTYCKDPGEEEECQSIQKWLTDSLNVFQQQMENITSQYNQKMMSKFIALFQQLEQEVVHAIDEHFSLQTVLDTVHAIKERKKVADAMIKEMSGPEEAGKSHFGIIVNLMEEYCEEASALFCDIPTEKIPQGLTEQFAKVGMRLIEKTICLGNNELALKIRVKLGETRLQETRLAFINGYLQSGAVEQAQMELSMCDEPTFQAEAKRAITQYYLSHYRIEEAIHIAFPQERTEKDTLTLAQSLCIHYWINSYDFDTALQYLEVMSEGPTKEQLRSIIAKAQQPATPGSKRRNEHRDPKEGSPSTRRKF